MLVPVLILLNSCGSIRPAHMKVPDSLLATTSMHSVEALGSGTRGSYRLAAHGGTFRRAESRLQFFELLDRRSGSARFTLQGPLIEGQIEAECKMRERAINLGVFSARAKPMSYRCEFAMDGHGIPARFELQEVREGLAGALNKSERRGEIAMDPVVLQIQSVHELEGSAFTLATPIGYLFLQNEVPVAAIELNGRPRVYLPAADDIPLQRAVVTAAIALAIFWDPADSLL